MAAAYFYSSTAGEYTLTGAVAAGATSIPLNSVTGLPTPPFKVVLDPGLAQEEIIKVAAVAGTTLTVTRGWDGSTAVAHAALAKVRHMMTAEDLRLSREHEDSTAAHGATGAVVGTTNTQVVTNKDLTSATNSFPATLATAASLTAHTGATAAHGATGAVVGTTNTQALSNKDLSSATNTFPATLATSASLTAHTGATAAHGVTGAVVGTTDTQTLTNKTLTSPALTGTPTVNGVAVPKIARGTASITIPAGSTNASVTVDLTSYGFSAAPKVSITAVGAGASFWVGYAGTVTATSLPVSLVHRESATTGGTVSADWIAIGS